MNNLGNNDNSNKAQQLDGDAGEDTKSILTNDLDYDCVFSSFLLAKRDAYILFKNVDSDTFYKSTTLCKVADNANLTEVLKDVTVCTLRTRKHGFYRTLRLNLNGVSVYVENNKHIDIDIDLLRDWITRVYKTQAIFRFVKTVDVVTMRGFVANNRDILDDFRKAGFPTSTMPLLREMLCSAFPEDFRVKELKTATVKHMVPIKARVDGDNEKTIVVKSKTPKPVGGRKNTSSYDKRMWMVDPDLIDSLSMRIQAQSGLSQGGLASRISSLTGFDGMFQEKIDQVRGTINESFFKGAVIVVCVVWTCHFLRSGRTVPAVLVSLFSVVAPGAALNSLKDVVAQSGEDDSKRILQFLWEALANILQLPKTFPSFFHLLSNLPRWTDGISTILGWFSSLIVKVAEMTKSTYLLRYVGLQSELPLLELTRDVDTFVDDFQSGTIPVNHVTATQCANLVARCREHFRGLSGSKKDATLRANIMDLLRSLDKIETSFVSAKIAGDSLKMSPVAILVNGGSGVGKTYMTLPFTRDIVSSVLTDVDFSKVPSSDYIYSRVQEQDFWDGYRNQWACVFDDFGQTVDVPGNPDNEYMNIIRACSVGQNPLHMSNLADKGRVFFHSEFVFASSNLKDFSQLKSIRCAEALERRFNICVTCTVKREYCTAETKDLEIWERRLRPQESGCFNDDMYEFHEFIFPSRGVNFQFGCQYTGRVFSYAELVALTLDKYKAHKQKFKDYVASLEKRRPIAQAGVDDESYLADSSDEFSDTEEALARSAIKNAPTYLECAKRAMGYEASAEERFEYIRLIGRKAWEESMLAHYLEGCVEASKVVGVVIKSDLEKIRDRVRELLQKAWDQLKVFKEWFGDNWQDLAINGLRWTCLVAAAGSVLSVLFDQFRGLIEDEESEPRYLTLPFVRNFYSRFPFGKSPDLQTYKRLSKYLGEASATNIMLDMIVEQLYVNADCESAPDLGPVEVFTNSLRSIHLSETSINCLLSRIEVLSKALIKNGEVDTWLFTDDKCHYDTNELPNPVQAQIGGDSALRDIVASVCRKSMYKITLGNDTLGFCLFVKGRIMLCPEHYVYFFKKHFSEDFIFTSMDSSIVYKFPPSKFLPAIKMGEKDLAIIRFPREMRCHQDITKFFQSDDSYVDKNERFKVALFTPPQSIQISECRKVGSIVLSNGDYQYMCSSCVVYNATTSKGDCGSLIGIIDPANNQRKLLGIHVGGSTTSDKGFATTLSGKELSRWIEESFPSDNFLEAQSGLLPCKPLAGQFITHGNFERGIRYSTVSKIVPSVFHNRVTEVKTAPAVLKRVFRGGIEMDPFTISRAKYNGPEINIDDDLLLMARTSLYAFLINNSTNYVKPEVYSFEQAVIGDRQMEYFDAIPRKTSCGYPWNVKIPPQYPGKTYFFGKEEEYDLSNERVKKLKTVCDDMVEKAKKGIRTLIIFADYLKDERRPLRKIESVSTRAIFASPIDYLINSRRYFLAFARWIMRNRIFNGIAVGVNYYKEWDLLAKYLVTFSKKMCAGDYTGFDGSQVPKVLWAIYDIIEQWYKTGDDWSAEDERIRTTFWEEVVNSYHLSGKTLYEWIRSLPSGHPLTVIINSLYNMLCFRMSWGIHNNSVVSILEFDNHVRIIVYGDDVLAAVRDCDSFNQNTIPDLMLKIGMTWDHERKGTGEILSDFRDITDVDFLKRGFLYNEERARWVCPLAMESILEPLSWSKAGSRYEEITRNNVDMVFRELPLHGREVFDQYADQILRLSVHELGYAPRITDYDMCLSSTLNTDKYFEKRV